MELSLVTPLAWHFTVYAVNRNKGLESGESMSDIAGHLASAIEHDVGVPVFLQGTSTGGSVVAQLAVDRPDLVRRSVVTASAYRLGPRGREEQAEMARLTRARDARDVWAFMMTSQMPPPLQGPLRPLARLAVGSMVPDDPTDVLVTLDAEDVLNVEADLPRITAPILFIGGGKDPFYPRSCSRARPRASKMAGPTSSKTGVTCGLSPERRRTSPSASSLLERPSGRSAVEDDLGPRLSTSPRVRRAARRARAGTSPSAPRCPAGCTRATAASC